MKKLFPLIILLSVCFSCSQETIYFRSGSSTIKSYIIDMDILDNNNQCQTRITVKADSFCLIDKRTLYIENQTFKGVLKPKSFQIRTNNF
jgi:hypothetical protein